jgi:hypothetical protein
MLFPHYVMAQGVNILFGKPGFKTSGGGNSKMLIASCHLRTDNKIHIFVQGVACKHKGIE